MDPSQTKSVVKQVVAKMDAMDKLHGTADITKFTQASWNIFRYCGDYLHLAGIFILIVAILKNQSVAGISKSTQYFYLLVFVTRYLDLFDHAQSTYLIVFKLTYIVTALMTIGLFFKFDVTYEKRNDSVNIAVILIPCVTAALLLTSEYSMLEVLWTFSEFLEAFAMVPQYIFCYRQRQKNWGATLYVLALGGYRVFYAFNWIYKKIMMPHYSDVQSWLGGIIEILFFVDFLGYRFSGNSFLRSAVLGIDTKINEISETLELKVLGTSRTERIQKREAAAGGEMRQRRPADNQDAIV